MDNKMFECITRLSDCRDVGDAVTILKEYELATEELVYCCLAASCLNRKQIDALENHLKIAERAILKKPKKKILSKILKP